MTFKKFNPFRCMSKAFGCGPDCCGKKKFIFFVVIAAVIFSSAFVVLSGAAMHVIEDEWIDCECNVTKIEWKEDLYDVYLFTNRAIYNPFKLNRTSYEGRGRNVTSGSRTARNAIKAKGWMYSVEVYYKNMKFVGAIRDPSSSELLAPLYEPDGVYDCMSLVERMRPENAFFPKPNATPKERDEEDDVFFVVTTQWKDVDLYSQNHAIERWLRITLVIVALVTLLGFSVCLKLFYDNYKGNKQRFVVNHA